MKKFFFINICVLFLLFTIIELILILIDPNHLTLDRRLGWKLKPNLNLHTREIDLYGNKYVANFYTNNDGFITIFNNKEKKFKKEILIIGDSFSTDPHISIDNRWYSIMANKFKVEKKIDLKINVIGAGGYGTLQQYMLLDQLKNKLKPSIIILQFCSNDFENNYLKLEKSIGSINQYARRPYLGENNLIYYENSLQANILRTPLIGDSRIINKIYFLLYKYKNIKKINYRDVETAEKITNKLLKKIRNIYPNNAYFIFNCEEKNKKWLSLQNVNLYNKILEATTGLAKSKEKKEQIYYKDGGHLNNLGNYILGSSISKNKKLSSYLKEVNSE